MRVGFDFHNNDFLFKDIQTPERAGDGIDFLFIFSTPAFQNMVY